MDNVEAWWKQCTWPCLIYGWILIDFFTKGAACVVVFVVVVVVVVGGGGGSGVFVLLLCIKYVSVFVVI